ncbi:3-oxoacid CoA-transferase subunit B [Alkalihalobacillus sp. 1P02AB]|uniref:3-oxoacid CoA-transferase subunit B n=1 Tax=Alkalihalobacillus sp. 1P02AB TaxID=3132260 RepID=UPI0039A48FB5
MGLGIREKETMAKRAEQEIETGMVVNLGIGIPSLVANFIKKEKFVFLQAENGLLGMGVKPDVGKEDPMICNAGGIPVTLTKGASYFDSATAFAMIRAGQIDLAILGALEVSEQGDLANWIVPKKMVPGIGGAIELAQKAKKVIVLMSHTNKDGKAKIVQNCTLPLTAKQCVHMIMTERAVIEVTAQGLLLKEIIDPFTLEDVLLSTEATLHVTKSCYRS